MSNRFFVLQLSSLCELAYELAEKNGNEHPFSAMKRVAGKDWVHGFLKRYPDLILRKPEPMSIVKAMAFYKVEVGLFFIY